MKKIGSKLQWNGLAVHILAAIGLYYYWDPLFLIWFIIGHKLIMMIGDDIGLHRYFSHKTFKTTKFYENMFIFLTWFNIQGSTIDWVARHRIHHAHTDKEKDPHPSTKWFTTYIWVDNYDKSKVSPFIIKDLLANKLHMFMHNYYFIGYWAMLLGFSLIFGFKFVLYFFVLNGVIGFHTAGWINVLCHKFGYRNFDTTDYSRNNNFVNMLHWGGGLHNNHHAFPKAYSNKVFNNDFDPSGWLIKTVFATNLSEIKTIADLQVELNKS